MNLDADMWYIRCLLNVNSKQHVTCIPDQQKWRQIAADK
jgi:hypothetical protein